MTKQCTCIICENREIERFSDAMDRTDAMQRPDVDNPPIWVGAVIIAAFAVWVVAMLVKTGVVL